MENDDILGQFSNSAYDYDLRVGSTFKFAPGYTVVTVSHTWIGQDGFVAFNPRNCSMISVNAGTDGFMDWMANVDLAIWELTTRHRTRFG